MAYLECPTRNDLPAFSYTIPLDGTTFTLSYTFNDRMNKWFLELGDQFGVTIVSAVPIVSSWPLFDRFKGLAIPKGTLFAFDSSGQDLDPARFDLGARVRIFYKEFGT